MNSLPSQNRTSELFPSQAPARPIPPSGLIQTIVSKLLFALLTPFSFLAGYGLLRSLLVFSGLPTIIDVAITGYILVGLLLWVGLLAITDAHGGGQIVTRVVWGAHVFFNILAIPFWISCESLLSHSCVGFPGLGWLATLVVVPVLAVSSTCFFLSFINTKHNP